MPHDVLAELQGYRNELAVARLRDQSGRARAIQAEIDRIAVIVTDWAGKLEAAAETLAVTGRPTAELAAEAKRYRDALGVPETAVHQAPTERAVPKKASR